MNEPPLHRESYDTSSHNATPAWDDITPEPTSSHLGSPVANLLRGVRVKGGVRRERLGDLESGTVTWTFTTAIAHILQVRVESTRFSTRDTEVDGYMTANWAGVVVNMLILGFFALAVIGIGLGVYAAKVLKRLEGTSQDKVSTES